MKNNLKVTTAKRSAICHETGVSIHPGDTCLYSERKDKYYSSTSGKMEKFRNKQFESGSMGFCY